jgi:hypothetical protein
LQKEKVNLNNINHGHQPLIELTLALLRSIPGKKMATAKKGIKPVRSIKGKASSSTRKTPSLDFPRNALKANLVYAQRSHGRSASPYCDYTFAVWSDSPENPMRVLVPFAKAYSSLTDAEMAQVDAIIRRTRRESLGPVRSVEPTPLFELSFKGIARSSRHKSGIAVRFSANAALAPGQTGYRGEYTAGARGVAPGRGLSIAEP